MARDIRARRVEVIHAHQYTPFFYSSVAGRLSRRQPRVIFTEHGRHYPDVVSRRRRLINQLLLGRLADRINAVCQFSADGLLHDGFSGTEIEVIDNGIDPSRYGASTERAALRARLCLDSKRRYVAAVARFHPVKDHATILHGFGRLATRLHDVDLLLVGDGPLREDLERLTASLGLTTRVHFLGVRADVPELLQAVDAFVLTSVSEAASITLLEAMASAIPIVATAVGGTPELVRDGQDALLVQRGDSGAIAHALERVLSDRPLASALTASARERVQTRFTVDRTIARYRDLYLESRSAA
jgi:L-malate glycosyltransferase